MPHKRKPDPAATTFPLHVFVNCPFDVEFDDKFKAMIFAISACGFKVRCAREMDDAGEVRLEKLYAIIGQSRFGIHDLSRVELDPFKRTSAIQYAAGAGILDGGKTLWWRSAEGQAHTAV